MEIACQVRRRRLVVGSIETRLGVHVGHFDERDFGDERRNEVEDGEEYKRLLIANVAMSNTLFRKRFQRENVQLKKIQPISRKC